MANEDIGDIECPLCKGPAHVRAYHSRKAGSKNEGKKYVHCPECGPLMTTAAAAQSRITAGAKMYATGATPAPAASRKVEKPATPAPAAAEKKTTFELDD